MKKSDSERIMDLEEMEVVKYYISFSAKSGIEQHGIINDYDLYLKLARTSEAGKIYIETRKALLEKNFNEVKRLGQVARELFASGDYEKAPEPFDPKYIGNQSQVSEYRQLIAKRDGIIPNKFKEALLD